MRRFSFSLLFAVLLLVVSSVSPSVSAARADATAGCVSLAIPDFISPEDGHIFSNEATPVLQWKGVANAAGYALFLWEEMDSNMDDTDGLPAMTTTVRLVVLDNLQSGHWYHWTVRAVNLDPACGLGPGHASRAFAYTTSDGLPPPRPYHLNASDGTRYDAVFLTWESERDDFKTVYRAAPGGELVDIGTSNDNQHTDWNAQPGVRYRYAVSACNDFGCGNLSIPDEGWRAEGCPALGVPDGLEPEAGVIEYFDQENGIFATAEWNALPGISEYQIELLTLDGQTVEQWTSGDHNTDFPELEGDFNWRVRALSWVNNCPPGDWTPQRLIRLRHSPEVLPPQNVMASDGAYPDRVRVEWSAPPANEGGVTVEFYAVFRAEFFVDDSSWELIGDNIEIDEFYDTTTQPGTLYYYAVEACTLAGCSDMTFPESGFAGPPTANCPVIPVPTGLEPKDGGVILTDRENGVIAYVKWDWIPGVNAYDSQIFKLDKTTLVRDDLDDGQVMTLKDEVADYYWRVKGAAYLVGCSDGPWSELRLVHVRTELPPLPPSNVSASRGDFNDRVWVTWQAAPPNENGVVGSKYIIYRADSQQGPWTELDRDVEALSYDDLAAQVGKDIFYAVAACSLDDCGEMSAPAAGFARPLTPGRPQIATHSDYLRLSWLGVTGISHYRVYRATLLAGEKTYLAEVNGTAYSDYPPVAGQSFYYWLKACGRDHCSEYSPPATGTVADVIALDNRIFMPAISRRTMS